MICSRCFQRGASRTTTASSLANKQRAAFSQGSRSSATPISAQTATANNPRPDGRPAATTVASVAQPFSTPLAPSTKGDDIAGATPKAKSGPKDIVSSIQAGTVLKGLNFLKNAQDPVALEDSQYPDWLWTVLERKESADGVKNDVDANLFSKSRKQRQRANKELRKQQALDSSATIHNIPLHEQTIDLPIGSSDSMVSIVHAQDARQRLTKSMREQRKSKIKEANFLKSMS